MADENSVLAWLKSILRRLRKRRVLDTAVVVAGLITIAAYSLPGGEDWQNIALQAVLWACLGVFTLEWLLAFMAAPSSAAYWRSPGWMLDAITVLPVPIALLFGAPSPLAWLLGAFWLFKLVRTSPGLARLGRVITLEARPLGSVLVLFLTILFFGAVALHLAERHVQPQAFGSLPSALWWAVATLTTTGYGDAVPVTQLGRVVAGFVMICGVGVFGLLTGILATGFVDESRRQNFMQTWQLVSSVPFFASLDAESVIELSRLLRPWQVAEGSIIIRRGNRGDSMYFITSGEVTIEIEPKPVRLGPGAFFGELALLGNGIRNATVRSTLPTTLLVLDLPDFRVFCSTHRDLSAAIEAEAQRRAESGNAGQPAADGRASAAVI
jgi:voltage-gated potassium channel